MDYGYTISRAECTPVAFASHEHRAMDIEGYDLRNCQPHGYELVFITNNIQKTYEKALTHGAIGLVKPVKKTMESNNFLCS